MEKIKMENVTRGFIEGLREKDPNLFAMYKAGYCSEADVLRNLGYQISGITEDYRHEFKAGDRVRNKEDWDKWGYKIPAGQIGTIVFTRLGLFSVEWDGIPYVEPGDSQRYMLFSSELEPVESACVDETVGMIKKITVAASALTKYEVEVWKMADGGIRFIADKITGEEIKKEWQTSYFKNPGEASCAFAEYVI